MYKLVLFCIYICCVSCDKNKKTAIRDISDIEIQPLIQDSLMNVRALEINKEANGFTFLTSRGFFGRFNFTLSQSNYKTLDNIDVLFYIKHDTITPNFRALALTKTSSFALSIGNPALLFKIDGREVQLVYKETHNKVFYDAMAFWNDKEGIAIGDPTGSCLSIIITRDGGNTWHKISCSKLPSIIEGEAAFAASNTNISIVKDHSWVATGGKASRVLYSPNKGKTWEVFNTPIIQGKATTGAYSIDFYDSKQGYAIGGDYTLPKNNSKNKMATKDGGRTWEIRAKGKSPDYRSCVQYVPNGEGRELVTLGVKGIDYSNNGGETWKPLSQEGFYTFRFLNDSIAIAGGNGRICKLIFKRNLKI